MTLPEDLRAYKSDDSSVVADLPDAETGITDGPVAFPLMPSPRTEREPKLWSVNESFPLKRGENIVGRGAHSAVRLRRIEVSRRHARITVSENHVFVEDLGSKNGTFVRGERIATSVELSDGDTICIGTVWLTFASAEHRNDSSRIR